MCSHPAHSWGPNTKASRAWRPKPQQLDQRATTWLPVPWMYLWCSNTLSSSRNTPTTFTDYLQKHFIFHQKHHSRPSASVCVRPSWSYVLLSLWKKKKKIPFRVYFQKYSLGSFLGDMRGNLGRPQFSMRSVSKAFQAECEISGSIG